MQPKLAVSRQEAVSRGLGHFGKWVSDGGHSAVAGGLPALPCTSGLRELEAAPSDYESSPNRVDVVGGSLASCSRSVAAVCALTCTHRIERIDTEL